MVLHVLFTKEGIPAWIGTERAPGSGGGGGGGGTTGGTGGQGGNGFILIVPVVS